MTASVTYRATILQGVTVKMERFADGERTAMPTQGVPMHKLIVGDPIWPPKYGDTAQAAVCEACEHFRILNTSHAPYCLKVAGCVNCNALLNAIATMACPIGKFDHLKGS